MLEPLWLNHLENLLSNYQPNTKDTDEMLKCRTQQEIQTVHIRPVNSLNKRLPKIDIMASSNNNQL